MSGYYDKYFLSFLYSAIYFTSLSEKNQQQDMRRQENYLSYRTILNC